MAPTTLPTTEGRAEELADEESEHLCSRRDPDGIVVIGSPPRKVADAYRQGLWDSVLRIAQTDGKDDIAVQWLAARADRHWKLSHSLVSELVLAMGWADDDFRGFSQLSREFAEPFTAEQARSQLKTDSCFAGQTDKLPAREVFFALARRRAFRIPDEVEVSSVERNLMNLRRDDGAAGTDSMIVKALIRSGAIVEAKELAESSVSAATANQMQRLMTELGGWARRTGYYKLAIPLLRAAVYDNSIDHTALLALIGVLHDVKLSRSLATRLFDELGCPAASYRGFPEGMPSDSAVDDLISELRSHLSVYPPEPSVAEKAWQLLPEVAPAIALDPRSKLRGPSAAAQLAQKLMQKQVGNVSQLLAAAIASEEQVASSAVLTEIGYHLLCNGQTQAAAWYFDNALNVSVTPLRDIKLATHQQIVIENYREHRVVYFNGHFYGFYFRAPLPILVPFPGPILRFKLMVVTLMAAFLPQPVYRPTVKGLHICALWVSFLIRVSKYALSLAGILSAMLKLNVVLSVRPAKQNAFTYTRSVIGSAASPRTLRKPRQLGAYLSLIIGALLSGVQGVFRSNIVCRLRYWRRHPVYCAESLPELINHIDTAITTGRAKVC